MRTLSHPARDDITLDAVLAALSDPHRRTIVGLLAESGDTLSGTCVATIGAAPSAGSHHLRVLREAGVTRTRIEGNRRIVSLRRDELDERFPGLLGSVLAVEAASGRTASTLEDAERYLALHADATGSR